MLQRTTNLKPKDAGGVLMVLIIGRISTEHQNIENIEASYRYAEHFLQQLYQGPAEVKLLGEQASGMLTSRASIREAEQLVAAGKVDLVISEDLSRIYRNPRHQYDFVQNAVDAGTRVICIGDNLDTADENWEVMMGAAALRHGLFIPDTRRRVRRTATNSFHQGGMVGKVQFGYRKLTKDEAASGRFGPKGVRLTKLAECTPLIRDMRDRFLAGASYAAIADRLNVDGVATGPYAARGHWTGKLIETLLRNPILSGRRTFRNTIYEPIFRTGEHRRRKNDSPETHVVPELAHLTPEEQEELWRAMDGRAAAFGAGSERPQKRRNIPRSRSIWPGQAAVCAICGGLFHYAGAHLRCQNSLPRSSKKCWNHVQMNAELTRRRVIAWLTSRCESCSPLRPALVRVALEHWQRLHCPRPGAGKSLEREISSLETQSANLAKAISLGGELDVLVRALTAVNDSIRAARERQADQTAEGAEATPTMSPEYVEDHLEEVIDQLARESFEFGDFLRMLFPSFTVSPVQALDTPQVQPRGKLRFKANAIPGLDDADGMAQDFELVVDLFEPPQRIRYLDTIIRAKKATPKSTLRTIAGALGTSYMTVKRALSYAKLMEQQRLAEPYRELHECPEVGSRWHTRRRTGTEVGRTDSVGPSRRDGC